jgi:type IV pilus assembly protein PilA
MKNRKSGFTLLEVLLIIGIIAVLAGIVIVAINPTRQLAQARNVQRKSDLLEINKALTQFFIDHKYFPAAITSTLTDICNTDKMASSSVSSGYCDGYINLSFLVPDYLGQIPTDAQISTASSTGYKIRRNSSIEIGLSAQAELEQVISINIPEEGEVVDACSHSATDIDCWSPKSTELAWGPTGVVTNVWSATDGAANTATLITLDGDYPAAEYCASLVYCTDNTYQDGTCSGHGSILYSDWYLPAKNELLAGWTSLGYDLFPDPFDAFFSSTEYDDPARPDITETDAYYMHPFFQGGMILGFVSKESPGPIRCLR